MIPSGVVTSAGGSSGIGLIRLVKIDKNTQSSKSLICKYLLLDLWKMKKIF